MKITKFKIENIKRVKVVAATVPADTGLMLFGGANAQGKTSAQDGLAFCLGGPKLVKTNPIRKGQKTAKVSITLDGDGQKDSESLIVERTWALRENGTVKTTLEIRTPDGYKAPTPQTLLDSLVGRVWQDPLAFSRLAEADQVKTLKDIVGLNFEQLDLEHQKVYDKRTEINRQGTSLKARYEALPFHENAPPEEVSVSKLMAEMGRIEEVNKKNHEVRQKATTTQQSVKLAEEGLLNAQNRIAELQRQLEAEQAKLAAAQDEVNRRKTTASGFIKAAELLVDEDVSAVRQQISKASETNEKVRQNRQRSEMGAELDQLRKDSAALTARLNEIDAEKDQAVAGVKWPIDGLGYDERGVTFNGIPFSQAATSEQLRMAVAISLAGNPQLKVLLVRDGSLLDDNGLKLLEELAEQHDCQIFLEYACRSADDRQRCSIVIEDGEVIEDHLSVPETAGAA